MKAKKSRFVGLLAGLLTSSALAQEVYVSGLAHTPVGDAVLDPPVERRLPVRNLGSSGQDGVEIKLRTASGGSSGVEVDGGLGNTNAAVRTRYKGWDGTIKGSTRLQGNADGTITLTADFSPMGAADVEFAAFDADGVLIAGGPIPPGGLVFRQLPCPDGSVPGNYWQPVWDGTKWVSVLVQGCLGAINIINWYEQLYASRVVVTPVLPAGVPPLDGMESMIWTAEGLSEMTIVDATLGTFGLAHHGIGSAHIQEDCDDNGQCDRDHRVLRCDNLGHSGQDGVAVDMPDLSHWVATLAGFSDPAGMPPGSSLRTTAKGALGGVDGQTVATMTATFSGGEMEVAMDFSPLQPGSVTAEYYHDGVLVLVEPNLDPNGVTLLATPTTSAPFSVHRCTWCVPPRDFGFDCGSNPDYPFRTAGGQILIGIDHAVVSVNDSAASLAGIATIEITTDAVASFTITSETYTGATPPCNPCDMNCDGSVNGQDIGGFIAALSGAPAGCSPCAADTNSDGSINGFDVAGFIACLGQP